MIRATVADLFTEVDEDVRAERVRALVLRLLPVIVAVVLVALVVGAVVAWRERADASRDATWSARYFAAQRAADDPTASTSPAAAGHAIDLFRTVTDAPVAGVRTLARLRLAQLLGDRNDATGAAQALDAVAADRAAPNALRQLATLLAVDRTVAAGHATDADRLRLATLEGAGAPFRALALDTDAALDIAAGRSARARRTYEALVADDTAPTGLRERASTMLQALGPAPAGTTEAGAGGTGTAR